MHTDGHRSWSQEAGSWTSNGRKGVSRQQGEEQRSSRARGKREEVPQWQVPPFLGGEELVARETLNL